MKLLVLLLLALALCEQKPLRCSCVGDPHCTSFYGDKIELPYHGHNVMVSMPPPQTFLVYIDHDSNHGPIMKAELLFQRTSRKDECPDCEKTPHSLYIARGNPTLLLDNEALKLPEVGKSIPLPDSLCDLKRTSATEVVVDCKHCSMAFGPVGAMLNTVSVTCEKNDVIHADQPSICTGQSHLDCYCRGAPYCHALNHSIVPLPAFGEALLFSLDEPRTMSGYLSYDKKGTMNRVDFTVGPYKPKDAPLHIVVNRNDDGFYYLDGKKISFPKTGEETTIASSGCKLVATEYGAQEFRCSPCTLTLSPTSDQVNLDEEVQAKPPPKPQPTPPPPQPTPHPVGNLLDMIHWDCDPNFHRFYKHHTICTADL